MSIARRGAMTLRTRFAVAAGLLVLVVIGMVGVTAYAVTSNQLHRQIDESLDSRMSQVIQAIRRRPAAGLDFGGRGNELFSDRDAVVQVIRPDRSAVYRGVAALPVSDGDLDLLASPSRVRRDTVNVDGTTYRTLSWVLPTNDGVLKIGLNTEETENAQDAIRTWFMVIGAIGFVMAGMVGWLFAARTARPIEELAATVEQIAATQDLDHSIEPGGEAEISRLARSFNTMLASLRTSRLRQQQLVQDASHELRTPLTSLRANTELLERPGLSDADRTAILVDMRAEIDELADLSSELSSLATDQRTAESSARVDLADVAGEIASRAQRRTDGTVTVDFDADGTTTVLARPMQLERAVQNLVDNAIKFGPAGSDVRIVVGEGRIAVHDSGPGISDADKPFVFDRFYRAVGSRSLPGSGLGLSIVKQFADDNGATVFVADDPSGGAVVGIDFGTARTGGATG